MSTFDDCYEPDDWLTSELADELLDGEIPTPQFADVAGMVHDIRALELSAPVPRVRGALAEYIGVGTAPLGDPSSCSSKEPPADGAATDEFVDLTTEPGPDRRSVALGAATFAGTLAAKVLLGATVAFASVAAAHAAGVIDLPGLPGEPTSVVVATDPPKELPFSDEDEGTSDSTDQGANEGDSSDTDSMPEPEESRVIEKPSGVGEHPDMDVPVLEEPAVEEQPQPEPGPGPEEVAKQQAIAELEEQLDRDENAVYAAAEAELAPLHSQKAALVEALNTTLGALEQARNEEKAPLYVALEEAQTAEDAELVAQIESELMAIYNQWEIDRDAAVAAAEPGIHAVKEEIAAIEAARDAQIEQLREEFETAVTAL